MPNPVVVKDAHEQDPDEHVDVVQPFTNQQTEHLLSLAEIGKKYQVEFNAKNPSTSAGLSTAKATEFLAKYGYNQLTPAEKSHPIIKYLEYLAGVFNALLLICGIVAYIIFAVDPVVGNRPNLYIGGLLIFVALANAYIEFYQSQKSQAILESFLVSNFSYQQNLIPSNCHVIRDGITKQISALELTLGDIVYLRSGDKAPADLVLFASTELKVDNSSLTGEAEPQTRSVSNSQRNPLEATNLVFNGSLAVNGEGYGIVIRVGDNTVIGQIAFLTSSEEKRISPMSQEINEFVRIVPCF